MSHPRGYPGYRATTLVPEKITLDTISSVYRRESSSHSNEHVYANISIMYTYTRIYTYTRSLGASSYPHSSARCLPNPQTRMPRCPGHDYLRASSCSLDCQSLFCLFLGGPVIPVVVSYPSIASQGDDGTHSSLCFLIWFSNSALLENSRSALRLELPSSKFFSLTE